MQLKTTRGIGGDKKDAARAPGEPLRAAARLHGAHGIQAAVLNLQRTQGNHYVQRLLGASGPTDGGPSAEALPDVESAVAQTGGGRPLEAGSRAQMESAFGADFSAVRVHTDAAAQLLNRAVDATAFTVGQNIFFSQGAYDPGRSSGRTLLAHELTHVVQQGGGAAVAAPVAQAQLTVSQPGDRDEVEAEETARRVTSLLDRPAPAAGPAPRGAPAIGDGRTPGGVGRDIMRSPRAGRLLRAPASEHVPASDADRIVMLRTDPQLYRYLKALSPVAREKLANAATGAFADRAVKMMRRYHMARIIELDAVEVVGTLPEKEPEPVFDNPLPTEGGLPLTASEYFDQGVARERAVREEADRALKIPLSEPHGLTNELTGYEYTHQTIIGKTANGQSAVAAAKLLIDEPNEFFPFDVVGLEDKTKIELGAIYDLQGATILLPNKFDQGNYVVVDELSPTSFRFRTLTGHFDKAGGIIKFTFFERYGQVILEQHGWAPHTGAVVAEVGPLVAQGVAWPHQAVALAVALAKQAGCPVTIRPLEKLIDR